MEEVGGATEPPWRTNSMHTMQTSEVLLDCLAHSALSRAGQSWHSEAGGEAVGLQWKHAVRVAAEVSVCD